MSHMNGWMNDWTGGQPVIGTVIGILVIVALVIVIMRLLKKPS
ncbi:MAG TPA: hypothetical protein VIK25_13960 [Gemmatimonadaceae bacterium]|jgi:hypothetical protein